MLMNASPLGLTVKSDCLQEIELPNFCDPCYFESKFLPRVISTSKKDETVLKGLVKAALAPIQKLSNDLCGLCINEQSEDCACFMAYYVLIGAPTSYIIDTTDKSCTTPISTKTFNYCGADNVYKHYCRSPCQTCETVYLDCETDIVLMKKIAGMFVKYGRLPATRKNIEDFLTEWFGRDCIVVKDEKGSIYWYAGQRLTTQEEQILPFIYSMMPVFGGVEVINVWEA